MSTTENGLNRAPGNLPLDRSSSDARVLRTPREDQVDLASAPTRVPASARTRVPARDSERSTQSVQMGRGKSRAADNRAHPHRKWRRAAVAVFGLNLCAVVGLFVIQGGLGDLGVPGGLALVPGRVAGLLGTDLILVQLMLMGRNPLLDKLFGIDRLARWHRIVGHASFDFIVAHVVLITIGYAQEGRLSIVNEIPEMVLRTRDVLIATIAFGLLSLVVVTSIKFARSRMRYESWFYVHLYAYLAIALAVPHEIFDGDDFVGHPATQAYWGALYVICVGALAYFRFMRPVMDYYQHRLHVLDVIPESDQTFSIYIAGRDLDIMKAESGQFFIWRFLCKGQWWQAHPYSLSAAPPGTSRDPDRYWLRITVKDLGRGSGDLVRIPIGTRVIAEGPYGTFTAAQRTKRKVLFIAGGIGITPLRALFETIPARRGDITFVYRGTDRDDMILLDEIKAIATTRDARLQLVLGSRRDYPRTHQPLGAEHLLHIVPDISDHDVYICGPGPLVDRVVGSLRHVGVADDQIHFEGFSY